MTNPRFAHAVRETIRLSPDKFVGAMVQAIANASAAEISRVVEEGCADRDVLDRAAPYSLGSWRSAADELKRFF